MAKIIIVDKSFAVGGIQTSLINMVKELKNKHEIDVLMFHNGGTLKSRFPEGVNIIEPCFLMRLHGMTAADARKKSIFTYGMRILTGIFDRLFTNRFSIWVALLFQKKLKGYDVAIAFHQEDAPRATVSGFYRFVSKKTDAPVKIGWIHYVPGTVSFDDKKNIKYMVKMDKLVCVSSATAKNFAFMHPILADKIDYCYNFQDIERIKMLSESEPNIYFDKSKFNCFSASRLTAQKAMPRAIRAFAPVLHKNPDVVWYIAGDGSDRAECERLILDNGLCDQVILLGALDNPYPYMKQCDLYILPSLSEAAPMVYGEAMICKAPIFTSNTISAAEMVPEKFGFICENTEEGLRNGFEKLLSNRDLLQLYKQNLDGYDYTNIHSIEKVNKLIEK
ncbi:MAG: glycosyltransferase [Ruminococcaceae bacterium]|nr:glycosyltransferase [Oscillospiraceae bacterium]